MGTLVTLVAPASAGAKKDYSEGGIVYDVKYGEFTMGATYATGGDTVPLPDAPPGGVLRAVEIVHYDRLAGMSIHWDGSTVTPKLVAFDEDNVSGIEAELANASAALAAVDVILRFIYRIGA